MKIAPRNPGYPGVTQIPKNHRCKYCKAKLTLRPREKWHVFCKRLYCSSICQYRARIGKYVIEGLPLSGVEIAYLTNTTQATIGVRFYRGLDLLTGERS